MDVHRIRFIEHEPKPIHCLAFSNEPSNSPALAVSRGDGSIEIWRTNDGVCYYKDVWVPGRTDGSVETLVWCANRLFTSGLTGVVLEWDLVHLRPLQSVDLCGGAVWCMQPNSGESLLAAGCEDGQVRLMDISSGTLSFARGLDKLEGRVLSISWDSSGDFVAVGGADSTIRKLDIKTGRCVLHITLDEYQSRSTLVWGIKILSDSMIVSADSLGKVQFWNSSHGTLLQSCSLHSADVLALAVSVEGTAIYSAGVDQKVVCLKKVANESKWLKSGYVRTHTHDVRALALSRGGLLASGGVDTQLVTCPTSSFSHKDVVRHHPTPDSSRFFSVAPSARVLVHQDRLSLRFWQLSSQGVLQSRATGTQALPTVNGTQSSRELLSPSTSLSSVGEVRVCEGVPTPLPHCTNGMPKNFLEIKCKGPSHILCSAVSADSVTAALSTVERMWVYHIEHVLLDVRCVKATQSPCFKMAFTPDGLSLVLATIDEGLKVFDTATLDFDNARTIQTKCKPSHPVTYFEISPDSKLVAVLNTSKQVLICSLQSGTRLCQVPRLDAQPTLFTFNLSCDRLVLFVGAERQLCTFSIADSHLQVAGGMTLDRRYSGRSQLASPNGLIPVPKRTELFAVYDSDCVVLVRGSSNAEGTDLGKDSRRKRKDRPFEGSPLRLRFVTSGSGVVLFVGSLEGELVLVERTWAETLIRLPPALARTQYGT